MLFLAGLALFLKILIPPGYMAAPPKPDGPAFALMLCTAEGMVSLDPAASGASQQAGSDDTAPSDEDGARHSPCVFAGHGLNGPVPLPHSGERLVFTHSADQISLATTQVAPGRGLAAPPPPATGPPQSQA